MLENLIQFDKELFLALNGLHNGFFDHVMVYASAKLFWIPFYLFLLYFIIKEFKWKTLLILLFVAILITLSDQISVHAFKNVFQRLRPCHEEDLMMQVRLVQGCGGQYGFVSNHATNSFALATFVAGLFYTRIKWLVWVMVFWAILVSYSRIYLGVHYPGDILGGAVLGFLIGHSLLWIYSPIQRKLYKKMDGAD